MPKAKTFAGRVIFLLHEGIPDEYDDVLHRPEFKLDRCDIEAVPIKRGIFLGGFELWWKEKQGRFRVEASLLHLKRGRGVMRPWP